MHLDTSGKSWSWIVVVAFSSPFSPLLAQEHITGVKAYERSDGTIEIIAGSKSGGDGPGDFGSLRPATKEVMNPLYKILQKYGIESIASEIPLVRRNTDNGKSSEDHLSAVKLRFKPTKDRKGALGSIEISNIRYTQITRDDEIKEIKKPNRSVCPVVLNSDHRDRLDRDFTETDVRNFHGSHFPGRYHGNLFADLSELRKDEQQLKFNSDPSISLREEPIPNNSSLNGFRDVLKALEGVPYLGETLREKRLATERSALEAHRRDQEQERKFRAEALSDLRTLQKALDLRKKWGDQNLDSAKCEELQTELSKIKVQELKNLSIPALAIHDGKGDKIPNSNPGPNRPPSQQTGHGR
jgi:hypothetical protein